MNLQQLYDHYKYIINGSVLLTFLIMVLKGVIQTLLINIIAFMFLTYRTVKLLSNKKDTKCATQLNKCLKKWVCYATYIMVETVGDFIFKYLPFSNIYNVSKLVCFLWIIQSDQNVKYVYNRWIVYFYKEHKVTIDSFANIVEQVNDIAKKQMSYLFENNYEYVKGCIRGYIDDLIRERIIYNKGTSVDTKKKQQISVTINIDDLPDTDDRVSRPDNIEEVSDGDTDEEAVLITTMTETDIDTTKNVPTIVVTNE